MNGVTRAQSAVLYAGALLGSAAIAPYGVRLIEQSGRSMSPCSIRLIGFAQNRVLCRIAIAVGPRAARPVDLATP